MNLYLRSWLDRIRNLLCIAKHAWRDPRVPLLARIFLVIAPLYWINPYDLIPDLQPGGFCDDLAVACLLVVMALRWVPEEVFRNARNAVNPAVCSVMCLSLVGLTAASAAEMKAPATGGVLSQPVLSSVKKIKDARIAALETEISANAFIKEGVDCKRNSDRERLETFRPQIHALKCSASLQNTHSSTREVATKNHPHANDNVTSVHTLLETTDNLGIHDNIAFDDSSAFHNRLPSFLTNRGGQRQLYSSEDAPAVLPLNSRPIQMPQQLTLGFFVAARPLSGGALCC